MRSSVHDENELNGIKLERYVLHTIQDDLISFNVHVPQAGDFFIEIFASLVEPDANPFGQSFKLKCVCKYKITCAELTQRMHPLPACASGEWGPMKALRHFAIVPLTHKQAIIEAQQAHLELKFQLPKSLKVHVKLHSNTIAAADLDRCVRHEMGASGEPLQLSVCMQLPDEAQYGLDIYARDPEQQVEKKTMSHCCKYLINFAKRSSVGSRSNATIPPIVGIVQSGSSQSNKFKSAMRPRTPPMLENKPGAIMFEIFKIRL